MMSPFLKSCVLSAVIGAYVAFSPLPSQAETFYIENAENRFSVAFPDTWARALNEKPDEKLTLIAPNDAYHAGCKVSVNSDRRFVIFPAKFDDEIQRTAVSMDFWDTYLGKYNNPIIDSFKDESGLGFGHASMVEVSYETADHDGAVHKRGVMFASLYHDQLYAVECSSVAARYDEMRDTFMGVIKSVNFDKVTHENTKGHYRGFDKDAPTVVQGATPFDVYTY